VAYLSQGIGLTRECVGPGHLSNPVILLLFI